MMYFSFVTLIAIGYGDIVPIQDFEPTLAIVEGIIGQFDFGILVACFVAVYWINYVRSHQKNLRKGNILQVFVQKVQKKWTF